MKILWWSYWVCWRHIVFCTLLQSIYEKMPSAWHIFIICIFWRSDMSTCNVQQLNCGSWWSFLVVKLSINHHRLCAVKPSVTFQLVYIGYIAKQHCQGKSHNLNARCCLALSCPWPFCVDVLLNTQSISLWSHLH